MRTYTKTVRVLELSRNELNATSDMLKEAGEIGHAERDFTDNQGIKIIVVPERAKAVDTAIYARKMAKQ